MLLWTEASVWWSNHSTVATYEHAISASLFTPLQRTGGDVESDEPGRYGTNDPALHSWGCWH
jgi:hypothetical protein